MRRSAENDRSAICCATSWNDVKQRQQCFHFAEHIRRRPQLRNTVLNLHDVLHGLTLAELWEHQQLSLDALPVCDSAPPSQHCRAMPVTVLCKCLGNFKVLLSNDNQT